MINNHPLIPNTKRGEERGKEGGGRGERELLTKKELIRNCISLPPFKSEN